MKSVFRKFDEFTVRFDFDDSVLFVTSEITELALLPGTLISSFPLFKSVSPSI